MRKFIIILLLTSLALSVGAQKKRMRYNLVLPFPTELLGGIGKLDYTLGNGVDLNCPIYSLNFGALPFSSFPCFCYNDSKWSFYFTPEFTMGKGKTDYCTVKQRQYMGKIQVNAQCADLFWFLAGTRLGYEKFSYNYLNGKLKENTKGFKVYPFVGATMGIVKLEFGWEERPTIRLGFTMESMTEAMQCFGEPGNE